jgi:hypothetical protein
MGALSSLFIPAAADQIAAQVGALTADHTVAPEAIGAHRDSGRRIDAFALILEEAAKLGIALSHDLQQFLLEGLAHSFADKLQQVAQLQAILIVGEIAVEAFGAGVDKVLPVKEEDAEIPFGQLDKFGKFDPLRQTLGQLGP